MSRLWRLALPFLVAGSACAGPATKWCAGARWWANRRRRLGCGKATLDRFDLTGETRHLFRRLPWVF